ncbi:MAG: hypothetical protein ACTHMA_17200 [Thermomicrobiales bacterium]
MPPGRADASRSSSAPPILVSSSLVHAVSGLASFLPRASQNSIRTLIASRSFIAQDACRVRIGHDAQHLAVLRQLARTLFRQEHALRGSRPTNRFTAALDDTYLAQVVAPLLAHLPTVRE